MNNQEYLEFAKQLAYDAGAVMLNYFGKSPESELKDDDTIVTIADKEINRLVIQRVQAAYPDHAVDGEEESHKKDASHVWVCDPIDGTNPFAMELPISVFSLALVVDGVPIVGVIYHPFTDKLYSAVKGQGAFINELSLKVSDSALVPSARFNCDWWYRAEYDVLRVMTDLSRQYGFYLLQPGSTTHMAALVARGEFVASIFPGTKGKNVDIAAAKVVVEEAGGKVTDLFGDEQRYDQDIKGAIVSNGIVHDQLVKAMKEGL